MHVFTHFGTFDLVVLQLILASKLSELEHFENLTANNQFRKQKGNFLPIFQIALTHSILKLKSIVIPLNQMSRSGEKDAQV